MVLVIGGVLCGLLFSAGEFVIGNGVFIELRAVPILLCSVTAIAAGELVLRSRRRQGVARNLR